MLTCSPPLQNVWFPRPLATKRKADFKSKEREHKTYIILRISIKNGEVKFKYETPCLMLTQKFLLKKQKMNSHARTNQL